LDTKRKRALKRLPRPIGILLPRQEISAQSLAITILGGQKQGSVLHQFRIDNS
jgi:hypothetical protein